ncbi:hypothetical protein LTR86_005427 [Recurvomyces mirabilis]|nr:hypothetical protein LTR86_005427 [Recurvomyces mirabilis]
MSAWDKTPFADTAAFQFNDNIQRRGGIWAESIEWNSAPGRSLSRDDYQPPSRTPSTKSRSPIELPAAPLFRDATSSWSPPASPTTLTPPDSPSVDSACVVPSPTLVSVPPKEKRKLGDRLYAASCAGDLEHIKLLLSLGADVNSRTIIPALYESFKPAKAGSLSPLAGATGHGQLDAVKYLLAQGAKLNPTVNESSSSPLHKAIRADDMHMTQYLLELGADVNSFNAYNTTPLMYAVKYGSSPMVSLILSYKPDFNQRSFIGACATHWAVWPNRGDIMELLLEAGADKDQAQADGSTVLHCAVQAEKAEIVEVLLKWGADPLRKNDEWETPLGAAESGSNQEILSMMKDAVKSRR